MDHPDAAAYLHLFAQYGKDFGPVYLEPQEQQYRLLFEQICNLLVQASDFNLSMPQEFRQTARLWQARDPATLAHMGDPLNRHFMLSDLHDYAHLRHTMGGPGW